MNREVESSENLKRCSLCGEGKPLGEFSKKSILAGGKQLYQSQCTPCRVADTRRRHLQDVYHLTPEEYDKMIAFQNGRCAICFRKPTTKKLNVDHEHFTGLIRGGLCMGCNKTLGMFRDDADRFQRAADYLRNPPAIEALGEYHFGLPGRVGTKAQKKIIRALKAGKVPKLPKHLSDPAWLNKAAAYLQKFQERKVQ